VLLLQQSEVAMTVPSPAPPPRRPTNLRELRRRNDRAMIVAGLVLLFGVGGGLIWHFYGLGALFTGWLCMGGGMAVLGVLWGLLRLFEIWGRSDR
jgi:hypothetical protein